LNPQIILFDTEYTAWEGSKARQWSQPWEHREIIQIAAVRIDEQATELDCFDCLIKPAHNPTLSAYLIALTGIQQADVDTRGSCFRDAFARFYAFCDQGRTPMFSYGDDPAVLAENFGLNKMAPAVFPAGMHDIRVMFERAGIDTQKYTSGTVYQAVGARFDLAAHNALNDVRSLAVTLRELARMGKIETDWMQKIFQ
jgi:inhibitor of KinA sporulation pathway (predicted exonuclease)